jgi:outer membrane receptor protein involved in Fe transport
MATYGGNDNRWTITNNFTWMKGTHSFKVGGDVRLTKSYQESDGNRQTGSGFVLAGTYTENALTMPVVFGGFTDYTVPSWEYPGNIGLVGDITYSYQTGGGTWNASDGTVKSMIDLLTYMSGSVSNIRQMYFANTATDVEGNWNDVIGRDERFIITDLRQKELAFFVKDDWRVNSNLSLNLGVRWEYYGAPWLDNGLTVGLRGGPMAMYGITGRSFGEWLPVNPVDRSLEDPSFLTDQVFIGPNSPRPDQQLFRQDYNNFGPAVGFAYNLPWLRKHRTTVRGGYQVSYRTIANMGSSGYGGSLAEVPGMTYKHIYGAIPIRPISICPLRT